MRHEGYESFWRKLCQPPENYGKLPRKKIKNNYGAALHNEKPWNDTDWWFALDITRLHQKNQWILLNASSLKGNFCTWIFWISIKGVMFLGCMLGPIQKFVAESLKSCERRSLMEIDDSSNSKCCYIYIYSELNGSFKMKLFFNFRLHGLGLLILK